VPAHSTAINSKEPNDIAYLLLVDLCLVYRIDKLFGKDHRPVNDMTDCVSAGCLSRKLLMPASFLRNKKGSLIPLLYKVVKPSYHSPSKYLFVFKKPGYRVDHRVFDFVGFDYIGKGAKKVREVFANPC